MNSSTICANCNFFNPNDDDAGGGACHRYPPKPMMVPQQGFLASERGIGLVGLFPPVGPEQSCGEWVEREMRDAVAVGSRDGH